MSHFSKIFLNNMPLIYFLYGQCFFIFGLAVANQNRKLSNPAIRKSLWLLAAFAILHGLYEWGNLLIPPLTGAVSAENSGALATANMVLQAVSFFLLLLFGLNFFLNTTAGHSFRILKYLPVFFVIIWGFLTLYFLKKSLHEGQIAGDILSRYLFCFPGSLFAGAAFYLKSREYKLQGRNDMAGVQTGASVIFLLYSLFAGLIVPEGGIGFSPWLNCNSFYDLTGFPVYIVRAIPAVFLTYCIISIMDIFDRDYRQRMEEIKKLYFLMEERERIAEDLHDGVQQIFFSIGLESEAGITKDNGNASQDNFKRIMELSGRGISEVRDAIYSLRSRKGEGNFIQALKLLAKRLSLNSEVNLEFDIRGEPVAIPLEMENTLFKVTQEILYNSLKHADASNVKVSIVFGQNEIKLSVIDDGKGFDYTAVNGRNAKKGMGIITMKKRISLVDGKIDIKSTPGSGTEVSTTIPIGR